MTLTHATAAQTSLEELFQTLYLPSRQNSPSTIRVWTLFFRAFHAHLGRQPVAGDLSSATLRDLMQSALASGYSVATTNNIAKRFVSFWRLLADSGLATPCEVFRTPDIDAAGKVTTSRPIAQRRRSKRWSKVTRASNLPTPEEIRDQFQEFCNAEGPHASKRQAIIKLIERKRGERGWSFWSVEMALAGVPVPRAKRENIPIEVPTTLQTSTPLVGLFEVYRRKKLAGTNPHTARRFRIAIQQLETWLQRPATIDDLNEDNVCGVSWWVVDNGRSIATGLAHRKKLVALWNFAFRRGVLREAPDLPKMKTPRRSPFAWNAEQLATLFRSVQNETWCLKSGVPFRVWLSAFLLVCWDSGERLGALLKIRWQDIDLTSGWLVVPAEFRKWKSEDKSFQLHTLTVQAVRALRSLSHDLKGETPVFHWPHDMGTLFLRYKKVLKQAGLPDGRKQMFHCIRKTVASFYRLAGGDAQRLLGHSTPELTESSYISPEIVKTPQPATLLFRPDCHQI